MDREKPPRLIRGYLRAHAGTVLLFAACAALFYAVLALYGANAEPVLYATALCAALLFCAALPGYWRYRKRAAALWNALAALPESADRLPEPYGAVEMLYGECVARLCTLLSQNEGARNRERIESAAYFTAWVHQVKTPISAMRLMLSEQDTAENRALLAELFRVECYAEMALTYARLESPSSDFVIHRVQVEPVVRAVVRQYAGQFVRRRLKLTCALEPAVVLSDEKWLAFILGQLLSNAVKYTREGSVTVRCTADGVLSVADTGVGIAPEDVPRVFEKGFTGLNGRAETHATGLGMYLSHTAAARLSHKLTVASELGKGTIFTLDMRRKDLDVRD